MEDNATVKEKIAAQEEYVKRTKCPYFAPPSGICFRCGRQIYERISLKTAKSSLIIGCPFCHRSYCS